MVAHGLFRYWRHIKRYDAHFLAATMPQQRVANPGTALQSVNGADAEYLLRVGDYDNFHHLQRDKVAIFSEIADLVQWVNPDSVILHHYLGFGSEIFPFLRRLLPNASIILTMHDYHFACHHDGTMVKTDTRRLCLRATPDSCHGCFPAIPAGSFKLRNLNLQHHFSALDHLVAPSATMRQRMIEWGLPSEKITVIQNGRVYPDPVPARPLSAGQRRSRFAVLGNVSPFKGQKIALEAVRHLLSDERSSDVDLTIHGAPIFQTDAFKAEIKTLVEECKGHVRILGGYDQEELPDRLADADWVIMPSTWWENAPLVLDEAFHHGRPPICSAIGGMAERVQDGVNGRHFTMGDPISLAERMREAMATPGLWEKLRHGAPSVRDVAPCAEEYTDLLNLIKHPKPPRRKKQAPVPKGPAPL